MRQHYPPLKFFFFFFWVGIYTHFYLKDGICVKLEKEMASHSSILAWEIPWMEEPGRLQTMGSQRVRHDLATEQTHIHVKYHVLVLNKCVCL